MSRNMFLHQGNVLYEKTLDTIRFNEILQRLQIIENSSKDVYANGETVNIMLDYLDFAKEYIFTNKYDKNLPKALITVKKFLDKLDVIIEKGDKKSSRLSTAIQKTKRTSKKTYALVYGPIGGAITLFKYAIMYSYKELFDKLRQNAIHLQELATVDFNNKAKTNFQATKAIQFGEDAFSKIIKILNNRSPTPKDFQNVLEEFTPTDHLETTLSKLLTREQVVMSTKAKVDELEQADQTNDVRIKLNDAWNTYRKTVSTRSKEYKDAKYIAENVDAFLKNIPTEIIPFFTTQVLNYITFLKASDQINLSRLADDVITRKFRTIVKEYLGGDDSEKTILHQLWKTIGAGKLDPSDYVLLTGQDVAQVAFYEEKFKMTVSQIRDNVQQLDWQNKFVFGIAEKIFEIDLYMYLMFTFFLFIFVIFMFNFYTNNNQKIDKSKTPHYLTNEFIHSGKYIQDERDNKITYGSKSKFNFSYPRRSKRVVYSRICKSRRNQRRRSYLNKLKGRPQKQRSPRCRLIKIDLDDKAGSPRRRKISNKQHKKK